MSPKDAAKQALACLDLTNLNDDCAPEDVADLAARGHTAHGPVAALCVWPRFVAQAKAAAPQIKIATVVNFPSGAEPIEDVLAMTRAAVEDGADEIDLVIPYASLATGFGAEVPSMVEQTVEAGGLPVKAILETGELADPDLIREASQLAIAGGAAFIKTSTGKTPVSATLEAARIMLEEIKAADRPVGLKPSGGIKTTEDAAAYLALADEIMGPGWARPETFRIGASSVLTDLLKTLEA